MRSLCHSLVPTDLPKWFVQEQVELPGHMHQEGAIRRLQSPVLGSRAGADCKKKASGKTHCAPEEPAIRSSCPRNKRYLGTRTLPIQAPTTFAASLEEKGRRFTPCSISPSLSSSHQGELEPLPALPFQSILSDLQATAFTADPPPFPTVKICSFQGCLWDPDISEGNYQMLLPEYPSDLWH